MFLGEQKCGTVWINGEKRPFLPYETSQHKRYAIVERGNIFSTIFLANRTSLHKLDGPTVIWACSQEDYWIHGKRYDKEGFDNHPLVREHKLKKTVEDLLNG